jgi:hypothetical protein
MPPVTHPTECVFYDPERCRDDRYDFGSLPLPAIVSRRFASAFRRMTGAVRVSSRRQAWRQIVRFAIFLSRQADGVDRTLADDNVLRRFQLDLSGEGLCSTTLTSCFNLVRRLLAWIAEDVGQSGRAVLRSPPPQFAQRGGFRAVHELTAEDLRRIVSLCKREIDGVIRDFTVRERLERSEPVDSSEIPGFTAAALSKLIALENEGFYTQVDIKGYAAPRAPPGTRWKKTHLRRAERYRALTVRTALPYYLLILIQTCANPQPIRDLKIDCIQPHPSDPLKRRIYWMKFRGQGEQAFDVLAAGRYAVTRCIEDLLRLTRPIRHLTSEGDGRVLMITRTGRLAQRISTQALHDALHAFRQEHSLGEFTFADLRKSAAAAIDRFTGSARAVSRALQHRSVQTARHYLKGRRSVDRRYERVLHFQGKMVKLATARGGARGTLVTRSYTTVTGMGCRDPLSGIAEGSVPGDVCLKWLECCRCPNAIIVKDDPAIVARIVRAAMSLREMQQIAAGSADSIQQFESAFRPTLHVIEYQILPKIATKVRTRAEQIAATLPALPLIE